MTRIYREAFNSYFLDQRAEKIFHFSRLKILKFGEKGKFNASKLLKLLKLNKQPLKLRASLKSNITTAAKKMTEMHSPFFQKKKRKKKTKSEFN